MLGKMIPIEDTRIGRDIASRSQLRLLEGQLKEGIISKGYFDKKVLEINEEG